MLPADDLEKYRAALLKMQREVSEQLEALVSWCEPVAPDVALGRLTRSDAMQDQQMAVHQRKRFREQQTRIKTALARIDAGTFGICPMCKNPIDVRRLDSAPDSVFCVPCMEKRQASRGRPYA